MEFFQNPFATGAFERITKIVEENKAFAAARSAEHVAGAPQLADALLKWAPAATLTPARREALHNVLTDDLRSFFGTVIPQYTPWALLPTPQIPEGMNVSPEMLAAIQEEHQKTQMADLKARHDEYNGKVKTLYEDAIVNIMSNVMFELQRGCSAVQLHRAIKDDIVTFKTGLAALGQEYEKVNFTKQAFAFNNSP